MERIPNYDAWKTTPSKDPDAVRTCAHCGAEMFEGDLLYAIDGGICEECLKSEYEETVFLEEVG